MAWYWNTYNLVYPIPFCCQPLIIRIINTLYILRVILSWSLVEISYWERKCVGLFTIDESDYWLVSIHKPLLHVSTFAIDQAKNMAPKQHFLAFDSPTTYGLPWLVSDGTPS